MSFDLCNDKIFNMKTLYLDCGMGASRDMLAGSLLELLPDKENFLKILNSLGIPGVTFKSEASEKCGIMGTRITVTDTSLNGHHNNSMSDIKHAIEELPVSEKIKKDIFSVYSLLAEAESHVHGIPLEEIHFHEVGEMKALAGITAVCLLMDALKPEQVVVSPVHVGSGSVKCAHGILPVPAPATAYILQDVPIYGGEIKGELCPPTAAALLKYFATSFGNMPVMIKSAIGYGMGDRDYSSANCVRALLGEAEEAGDRVIELTCNFDDITAEAIGYAEERLFAEGALEIYTIPIQMKKSRPGTLLTVMCLERDKDKILNLIFKHTTTLGVRENISRRYTLSRSMEVINTDLGEVHKKVSSGYGVKKEKYEYEDLAKIARENNMSLAEVREYVRKSSLLP